MVTAVTLQFMDIPRSESRFISQNCTFSSMDFLFIQSTGSVENCWFEVNTTFIYMSTGFLGSVLLGQICLYYTINKIGRKIPLCKYYCEGIQSKVLGSNFMLRFYMSTIRSSE